MNNITQRDSFWNKVYDLAKENKDIIVLSADMGAPSLDKFRTDLSAQFVNVGIAEQNAILIASGLAKEGKRVFVYAIAPFITFRCLEQIRVNNSMMKIPITIVGVGAGFGYEDSGPTHHMIEDIALMRSMPDIVINSISDSTMAAAVAEMSTRMKKANYVRLDRLVLPTLYGQEEDFSKGVAILRPGDIYIAATGSMVHVALEAAEKLNKSGVNVGVVDVYTIPINEKNFVEAIDGSKKLIALEEHFVSGGFGGAICEVLQDNAVTIPVKRIGLSMDQGYCYKYGGRDVIRQHYGIDADSVVQKINEFLK
ncbi:MAG: transketolase C-terminal domain-containing protein [Candidatus Omnitrophica bacterium]|nr:transketolase C-terminal domain-containing protein [Candidatus Omnitrophota bacterium]